ncbi:MAG: DM13 domain-containing protein [Actinomycetota bacterium]|nr:DM13 domain-containing protein [Actinomycetota bacterium]
MRASGAKRLAGLVIVVVMAGSAAYSANTFGVRDRFAPPATKLGDRKAAGPVADPTGATPTTSPSAVDSRSQPWWQPVVTQSGTGATTTPTFAIDTHALQWRTVWRCEAGPFSVVPVRASGDALRRPLAEVGTCPEGGGTGYSVTPGSFSLRIAAAGPWEVTVEQQVDVPLVEDLTPEMKAPDATVEATYEVYNVDRVGRGVIKLYRLGDGRRVLRLEDFFVSINSDLEIRLSELARPTSTDDIAKAAVRDIVPLKATTGAMNYPLPHDVDLKRFRSIVIWCELTRNAYAAAAPAA